MAFPIRIHRIEDTTGLKFKAATSVEALSEASTSLNEQLKLIEMAYDIAITAASRALHMARTSNRTNSRAIWFVADHLKQFTHQIDGMGFFLADENTTFARDLGMSESSVKKIKSFYRRFPSIWEVNPMTPWNEYRENRVPPSEDSARSGRSRQP